MKSVSYKDAEPKDTDAPISLDAGEDSRRRTRRVPFIIGGAALLVLLVFGLMVRRAEMRVNRIALNQSPKPVTVVEARAATFRPSRAYVGTIDPWVEAKVGPQLVSAYVDTVLVRPGAVVKKGEVLATLDCRNASAGSQAVAMQARAIDAEQKAVADEAARLQGLLDGGFVSPNEAEQKTAQSAAREAQLLAAKAKLMGSALEVSDCVLRSPFDGEIATRSIDPGAFVHPGMPIVSVVDRSTVRISADAPESDFDTVAPRTEVSIHAIATDRQMAATISRRAPAADPSTRTVHFEIDVSDPKRDLPVGTTADLRIDVGTPQPATAIPLYAATVKGAQATFFVAESGVAHQRVVSVKGEREGELYLDTELAPRSSVVSQGRALLNDNDHVLEQGERAAAAPSASRQTKGRAP